MASKSGKISIGIRKAQFNDLVNLEVEVKNFNMPHSDTYKILAFAKLETTFIAFEGQKIVGFVSIRRNAKRHEAEIVALYNRLGYERRGIGSKLLGKATAFAIAKKAKLVALTPGSGNHLVKGRVVQVQSRDFYARTPFEPKSPLDEEYRWKVKRKVGVRRPIKRPSFGLAPQNVLNPKRRLTRRR